MTQQFGTNTGQKQKQSTHDMGHGGKDCTKDACPQKSGKSDKY